MNMYYNYKNGRDASWQALIKADICEMPVDLKKVADAYDIQIISFKEALKNKYVGKDKLDFNLTVKEIGKKRVVLVNADMDDKGALRYIMAKGLGYCIMAKNINTITKKDDYEANIFARDLLMPACVLYSMEIESSAEIACVCNVNIEAAEKRAERMAELIKRKRFNAHPLERQVAEQFDLFVNEYNYRKL